VEGGGGDQSLPPSPGDRSPLESPQRVLFRFCVVHRRLLCCETEDKAKGTKPTGGRFGDGRGCGDLGEGGGAEKMVSSREDGARHRRHPRNRACGGGGAGGAGGHRAHMLPEGGGAERAPQGVGGPGIPRHHLRLRSLGSGPA
jgi:hypothetical protein